MHLAPCGLDKTRVLTRPPEWVSQYLLEDHKMISKSNNNFLFTQYSIKKNFNLRSTLKFFFFFYQQCSLKVFLEMNDVLTRICVRSLLGLNFSILYFSFFPFSLFIFYSILRYHSDYSIMVLIHKIKVIDSSNT